MMKEMKRLVQEIENIRIRRENAVSVQYVTQKYPFLLALFM